MRLEHQPGTDVARVLEADRVAGIEQQPAGDIQGFLQPRDDGDLLGRADGAARRAEVIGHRFLQRLVAHRARASELLHRRPPEAAGRDLCPQSGGKEVERGQVRAEGASGAKEVGRKGSHAPGEGRQPRRCSPPRVPRLRAAVAHLQQFVRQHPVHVGARPDRADEIPFGRELLESAHHRAPGELVLPREIAGRWETGTGAESALEDLAPERGTEPPGRGCAGRALRQRQGENRRLLRHNGTTKISKMALVASPHVRYSDADRRES